MYTPFQNLPSSARVWIYQGDRKLSENELTIITDHLKLFTERWQTHGKPMISSFEIRFDQFVVIAADEDLQAASGCSIDDSVRVITEVGKRLGIDFFNRQLVLFKMGEELRSFSLAELKSAARLGLWNEKTITFNNLIKSRAEFEANWMMPAGGTWLKRYLNPDPISEKRHV